MEKRSDGGPMFPAEGESRFTILDSFAGDALQGMLACPDTASMSKSSVAMHAYEYGEAMMAEKVVREERAKMEDETAKELKASGKMLNDVIEDCIEKFRRRCIAKVRELMKLHVSTTRPQYFTAVIKSIEAMPATEQE